MANPYQFALCAAALLLSASLGACADDDRVAGRWSVQWTVRNPNNPSGNPFTPPLPLPGQPQTPTITIQEILDFTSVSSQSGEGRFALRHYEGGRQTHDIRGGYRFKTNPLLNGEDVNQIEFRGTDDQGLPKTWSTVLSSLTPTTLSLKELYGGGLTTYQRAN
jgi:hypothetical protein